MSAWPTRASSLGQSLYLSQLKFPKFLTMEKVADIAPVIIPQRE
jgi:hypothetical protein